VSAKGSCFLAFTAADRTRPKRGPAAMDVTVFEAVAD
jgi:hypothetical protein